VSSKGIIPPSPSDAEYAAAAAANEAARSRVFAGIHWTFDSLDGLSAGRALGDYVVSNFLLPVGGQAIAPQAAVESVVVNDGSAPRSRVTSLTVTFSTEVTLDAGAFELRRSDGSLVELAVAADVVDGRTVAVLTFAGGDIVGGSLADGNYTLAVRGDLIHDAFGRDLDGDGDGQPGGDRVDAFFRYFGDSDGDRDVDDFDLALFDYALNSQLGDTNYLWYFDFGGDNDVDESDLFAFEQRYGGYLFP